MTPLRIFISSVQTEFARERVALCDYLRDDPLMRRFFEVFLFEDVPASDRQPGELYLDEVERCDLYVGLFGNDYGNENEDGISPTEREFDQATMLARHRLIFVKGTDDAVRHPKMLTLVKKAQTGLIRKRFNSAEELVAGLYAALVEYLETKDLIRFGPFDAAPCNNAELDDLDFDRMAGFIRRARRVRQLPLDEDTAPEALLKHLDLLNKGQLTNAAILLFGKAPQRFLLSSEIKCAHFHGTEVAKPIPSYQVYKGTVFDLVDQAADFVLSKINRWIGTRAESAQAPRVYEIPEEVITEAIVNAVVHRDYTDNGSVQVMLFADRLEVWNPGRLPPPLTLEELRVPHRSVPGNPLLANAMYLAEYIERMGTGTLDMIRRCADAGLSEPEFEVAGSFMTRIWRAASAEQPASFTSRDNAVSEISEKPVATPEVTPEVAARVTGQVTGRPESQPESRPESQLESRPESLAVRVLRLLIDSSMSKAELSGKLGQKEVSGQLNKIVRELLADQMIEQTIPDKPGSRLQKYRLTDKGNAIIASLKSSKEKQ